MSDEAKLSPLDEMRCQEIISESKTEKIRKLAGQVYDALHKRDTDEIANLKAKLAVSRKSFEDALSERDALRAEISVRHIEARDLVARIDALETALIKMPCRFHEYGDCLDDDIMRKPPCQRCAV